MNVLIVAQNLFSARLLVSLAEVHKSIGSYRVIVFSSAEKFILSNLHGVSRTKIVSPSDILGGEQLDDYVECIEVKRGMFSHDTVKRLQSDLAAMLESQAALDFQYIWIFNESTFIGSFLRASQDYAPKCIVFENSNKNKGVTILGDIFRNSGERLRNLFLHPNSLLSSVSRIRHPKFYRIITIPFHIRSALAFNYYFKRFFVRVFNIASFFLIKHVKMLLKSDKNEKPIVLIALQIRDDSAIAMNVDFSSYCEVLINKVVEIQAKDPELSIVVRPHVLDYTLGWMSFFLNIKRRFPKVRMNLSDINKLSNNNVAYLVNFNSNIVRHTVFQGNDVEIHTICSTKLLPSFDSDILQIQENCL